MLSVYFYMLGVSLGSEYEWVVSYNFVEAFF